MAMTYISRSGAQALIQQGISEEIFQGIQENSCVLGMARRLADMTGKQMVLPVLDKMPISGFVNGDAGLKPVSDVAWVGQEIVAEEIAVIVAIPDSVRDDANFDVWGYVTPRVAEEFGRVIDRAILYGENAPSSWPQGLIPAAVAKGKKVVLGEKPYEDIMGKNGLIAKVEQDGYMVSGFVASMPARGMLRSIVDTSGQPVFRAGMSAGSVYALDGQPIVFPKNGAMTSEGVQLLGGDFEQLVYSVRQDITVKELSEATLTDAEGKVLFNLPQQDMTALRFVMRLGWQLPLPATAIGGVNRFPFAILASA